MPVLVCTVTHFLKEGSAAGVNEQNIWFEGFIWGWGFVNRVWKIQKARDVKDSGQSFGNPAIHFPPFRFLPKGRSPRNNSRMGNRMLLYSELSRHPVLPNAGRALLVGWTRVCHFGLTPKWTSCSVPWESKLARSVEWAWTYFPPSQRNWEVRVERKVNRPGRPETDSSEMCMMKLNYLVSNSDSVID